MREALILLLKFYRRYISPLKPPTCRYVPTCSEYSIRALQKYGLLKGGIKSVWRVLRCNPFSKGGYDPP
ncbi:MAG: membrane protein insertion efficiency factor YidD [Thermotogae bacterium]|nr:membrane protein insertion efficiency factor YidD [Thermotogota bacterium]